jgi:hypothetical protein
MWVAATDFSPIPDDATKLHPGIRSSGHDESYFKIKVARSAIARVTIRVCPSALSSVQALDGRLALSQISLPEGHDLIQDIRKRLHEALPDVKYPFAPTVHDTSVVLLCAKVGCPGFKLSRLLAQTITRCTRQQRCM